MNLVSKVGVSGTSAFEKAVDFGSRVDVSSRSRNFPARVLLFPRRTFVVFPLDTATLRLEEVRTEGRGFVFDVPVVHPFSSPS